jgi:DNA helicase-2/ATP-dependent DNA helicase PcrA
MSNDKKNKQISLFENSTIELLQISYSAIALYNECPFRYKLIYIDKLSSSKKQRYYLMMGNTLHSVLRDFFALKKEQRNESTIIELLENRWIPWKIDKEKEKESYNKCKEILREYIGKHSVDSNVFQLEYPFKIRYRDAILKGKMDRIDQLRDESYEIIDYKLGDIIAKSREEIKNDMQWIIYWHSFKELFPKYTPSIMSFIYLGANTKVSIIPTEADENEAKNKLEKIINIIKNDQIYKKTAGIYCNNCYFYQRECKIGEKNG